MERTSDFLLGHYATLIFAYWNDIMSDANKEAAKYPFEWAIDSILREIETGKAKEAYVKRRDLERLKETSDKMNWYDRNDMQYLYSTCCALSGRKLMNLFE